MKRIFASLSLLITLVAGSLAFGAGTAAAAVPTANVNVGASLKLNPSSAAPGETVTADATCRIGTKKLSSDAISVFNGGRGKVRDDIPSGDYSVTLTCEALNLGDGDVAVDFTATANLRVTRDGSGCDRNRGCGNDNDRFRSCADYARDGIYNINRGDRRYRDALDVDDDGVACERNGDDNDDRWDRNRGCRELTDARDEARKQIQEANEKITEVVAASSDEGAKVTDSEALARDEQIRQAHDAIKKFNEEVEDSNRRCNDADDDLGATLLPIPGDNGGDNTTINLPPASSGGSNNDDGNVSSGNTPKGGIETGNGVETDPELVVALIAAVLAMGLAVGLAFRYREV